VSSKGILGPFFFEAIAAVTAYLTFPATTAELASKFCCLMKIITLNMMVHHFITTPM
jgi:hypothetical protein